MSEIIIKTIPAFDRKAKELLTEASLEELFDFLADHPEKGSLIQGTGGIRKLRWPGKGNKGKSGGTRVLYHYTKGVLVLLIMLYSKSQKENITAEERNKLKKLMPQLVTQYRED